MKLPDFQTGVWGTVYTLYLGVRQRVFRSGYKLREQGVVDMENLEKISRSPKTP